MPQQKTQSQNAKLQARAQVAVIGRPNAGKSTLLNALAGRKASIVSHKRQTTRAVVRAVCTCGTAQAVFEDTPGWQARYGDSFSRTLNSGAEQSAAAAAVVVYVVAALDWHEEDNKLLQRLPPQCVLIVAVNKIDLVAQRNMLLPFFATINDACKPNAIVPISALKKRGLQPLLDEVAKVLAADDNASATTKTKTLTAAENKNTESEDATFAFAEILREKLFIGLGGELPYRAGVIAHYLPRRGKTLRIAADVYVEKESQKAIVIGAGGAALKKMATAARHDMEKLAGEKICLIVRVRARKWRQDDDLLLQMRIGT